MTGEVVIAGQLDALVWQCVDDASRTGDTRAAVARLEAALEQRRLAAIRASVSYYLGHDWLVDLLRETDPRALGERRRAA